MLASDLGARMRPVTACSLEAHACSMPRPFKCVPLTLCGGLPSSQLTSGQASFNVAPPGRATAAAGSPISRSVDLMPSMFSGRGIASTSNCTGTCTDIASTEVGSSGAAGTAGSCAWHVHVTSELQALQNGDSGGSGRLNASQATAVRAMLLGPEPVQLITGPPGTGKTTVIAQAVCTWLQRAGERAASTPCCFRHLQLQHQNQNQQAERADCDAMRGADTVPVGADGAEEA